MKRKTNKSERNIKKILICSVLIVIAVFVFFERDKFLEPVYYESQISTGKFEDILLINNDAYAYQYRTGEIEPTQLMLKFENMNRFETQGVINLCVYDQKNELVADSEVTAASLKSREDWENFQLSKPLEANQKYKIVVSAQNVKNAQGVYLVVDKGLQEAVTKEMAFTRAFLYNGCFLLLLGAFIFACIPWSKVEGYLSEDADRDVNLMLIFSRSLLIITPVLCFIIVESMSGGLIFILNMDNTKILFVLNVFLYIIVTGAIYLLVNRTMITVITVTLLAFLFGLLNFNLTSFKGAPFIASDIFGLTTGLNVVGNYTLVWDSKCIFGFVLWITIVAVAFVIGNKRGLKLRNRAGLAAGIFLALCLFYYVYIERDVPGEKGIEIGNFTIASAYLSTGSLLSFVITATNLRVEAPEGYRADEVNEILESYESDNRYNEHLDKMPNVIVVMNEAFADIQINKPFALNQDYMPYYHSLKENTIKGYAHVSVYGSRTANSEFEFLTGCSMSYLPENSFPYQTYILKRMPSLTQTLKAQGYEGNIAFHPYIRTGWNRTKVYPLLGFEKYLAEEDVDDPKYVRSVISDESNYDTVIREYEKHQEKSEEPFYLFNVTMQNHGGYRDYQGVVDSGIAVLDEEYNDDTVRNYLNLMKKSDQALEGFIEYFAAQEEDTIIVFFGDHQPKLDGVYFGAAFGAEYNQISLKDQEKLHKTPYMIWANYDIPEGEMDISLNYLYPYLLSLIDANMTGYEKYLLDTFGEMPVVSATGYMGADGIMRGHGTSSAYLAKSQEYRKVQYNLLFDRKNWPEEKYFLRSK